jgi:Protein of unknown function (DUF4231)
LKLRGRNGYAESLKRELAAMIESLDLGADRKRFLESRWLDQVVWVEKKAIECQRRYYALRVTTVVGAVLLPALVSVTPGDDALARALRITVWVVSLVVAISAALEQFFRFGDRWRNYRQTAERLKSEGWLFFQLSGPYAANGATHGAAFSTFATRVEEWIKSDVDVYLTEITVERERRRDGGGGSTAARTPSG